MNINTDYWGDNTTWLTDTFFWSTNAGYTDTDLAWYNAANRTFETNTNITINTPIDYSICYAAQAAAEKMPLADIEVYDYTGEKVVEQKENAGYFFCDIPNVATTGENYISDWDAMKNGIAADIVATSTGRWLEEARETYSTASNLNLPLRPVVQFGIKSLFFDIRVVLIKNDYTTRQDLSLKQLETNMAQYTSEWHIESCFGRLYTYSGRNNNNRFNNFSQNNRAKYNRTGGGSIAIDKNLKIVGSNKVINNYSVFISNGYLPIFGGGVISVSNYRNQGHYGILINKRINGYHQYYNSSFPVCMASSADLGVSSYETTNEYNETVYLLNPKMSITAENCEKLRKGAAAYGLFFTDSDPTPLLTDTTNTNRWINENMYCGVLDSDGIGHGEYTKGVLNATNDVYNYDNSSDSKYNPNKGVDPNSYSDTTNWNNVDFRQAFTKRYILTGSQVAGLASELWAAQSSKPADIDYNNFAIDEYLTNNPIDTIVSLKYFPCTFTDTAPAIVHLGKYTTNIAATALGTSVRIIDFAPIECFPHFDDFRDYEPYTEIAMYIPFCGTVKIPTAECMGNYVSVKLAIDTNTGAATGYIIVSKTGTGGICVATCQGMAAIDIPVSGLQSANLANAVFNATANWTQTQINNISANSGLFKNTGGVIGAIARGMTDSVKLSDVKGGILGGPIGAAGSLVNRLNPISALQSGLNIDLDNAKADYELSHIQVPTRLVGSASPVLGCVIELDCRLIIYRPVTDETALSNYADTVGFATVKGGTVSQFSGFTVGTIDVSGINATAKEKQAIAAAFANGVYL